jgi:hypothetical protein
MVYPRGNSPWYLLGRILVANRRQSVRYRVGKGLLDLQGIEHQLHGSPAQTLVITPILNVVMKS